MEVKSLDSASFRREYDFFILSDVRISSSVPKYLVLILHIIGFEFYVVFDIPRENGLSVLLVGQSLDNDYDEIWFTASPYFFDPRSFILLLHFEIYQMHVLGRELHVEVVKFYFAFAPNK